MELNEMEKRLIFQTEGYGKSDVTYELRMCLPYIPDPVRRKTAAELVRKLDAMPEKDCLALIQDIRKNYRIPAGPKTMGELLAEARQKSGAEKLKGHDIMALERFDPEVKHMIVFDVLSGNAPVGDKGDKMRLFLTDAGYQKFIDSQERGECYGFELYKNGELSDSCWGFMGGLEDACKDMAAYLPEGCRDMVAHLEEQDHPATIIKTLLKHAKIQVDQAAKAFEHAPRQQVIGDAR